MNGHKLVEYDAKFKNIQYLFDKSVVKRHLMFLKAFCRIAQSIDENFVVKDPSTGVKSPSPPMRVYLSKAVYRYHIWITKCLQGRPAHRTLSGNELPPLDVLFILHAHMIAPSRFDEDARFHFPELGHVGCFPLEDVVCKLFVSCRSNKPEVTGSSSQASRIDVETGHYEASPEQVETWQHLAGIPFDSSAMANSLDVTCPSCHKTVSVFWVGSEQARSDGKGYGEPGFSVECNCGLLITHDTLATQKFVEHLQKNILA
jgi:hypothetical protein